MALLTGLAPIFVLSAFAENDILQVLPFSVLLDNVLNLAGKQASGVACLISRFSHIMLRITGVIVHLAPLGVFGAVTFTTVCYGVDSLSRLDTLVLVFYAICLVFATAVLGSVLRLSGVRMLSFLRYFHEELMVVMGTASSDAVLPQVIRKLERMGIRSSMVGLVVPTGYSFSLDGFSICLTLAVVLIAYVTGTPPVMTDLVTILLVSLVTSRDTHGIPGSALVIPAAILTVVPAIPVAGLVPVFSVDWFMSIGHALINLISNCVATMTVARWENDTDMSHVQAILDGRLRASARADSESLKRNAVTGEGRLHN